MSGLSYAGSMRLYAIFYVNAYRRMNPANLINDVRCAFLFPSHKEIPTWQLLQGCNRACAGIAYSQFALCHHGLDLLRTQWLAIRVLQRETDGILVARRQEIMGGIQRHRAFALLDIDQHTGGLALIGYKDFRHASGFCSHKIFCAARIVGILQGNNGYVWIAGFYPEVCGIMISLD